MANLVLIAAGFLGSEEYVTKAFGVEVNARTNVATPAGEYRLQMWSGCYSGRYAQRSVTGCMGNPRRRKPQEIDVSLMGYTNMNVQ